MVGMSVIVLIDFYLLPVPLVKYARLKKRMQHASETKCVIEKYDSNSPVSFSPHRSQEEHKNFCKNTVETPTHPQAFTGFPTLVVTAQQI